MLNRTSTVYRAIGRINRNLVINPKNRKKLKNNDFSIISNNCTGSLITHDLGKRFLTPTVNLFIYTRDFMKFITNLDFYLNQEIEQIYLDGIQYPVGKLGDIEIHFMHYQDINEAKEKWYERCKRINYDNLFIMMTDNDGCTEETIKQFDTLPYKNKILFTNKKYEGFDSTFYVKGFDNEPLIGDLSLYKNILGQKFYDEFNYVQWLNTESV